MTSILLTLILDSMMAMLLIATIVFCLKLNKRIKVLHDSKSELAGLIQQFDQSIEAATQNITEIHEASKRISDNIQHRLDKANFLADDLQFMIEKGNKLADRMEGNITTNRPSGSARPSAQPSRGEAEPAPPRRASAPAREAAPETPRVAATAPAPTAGIARSEPAIPRRGTAAPEAMPAQPAIDSNRKGISRMRSQAEQELMEAMKATGGNKA